MTTNLKGGCACGAIRYEANATESIPYVCHCTDCQKHSGAPFHAAIVVAADDLTVMGTPKVWTKDADSGRSIARHFCGDCGGHLFTSPWPEATRFSLKAGTLDDPSVFAPAHQIWAKSRVPWVSIGGETGEFVEGFIGGVTIGAK